MFTPTTRRNCRQLVADSCSHRRRRRDKTVSSRRRRRCVLGINCSHFDDWLLAEVALSEHFQVCACLCAVLHSPNEPSELLKWMCHNDGTIYLFTTSCQYPSSGRKKLSRCAIEFCAYVPLSRVSLAVTRWQLLLPYCCCCCYAHGSLLFARWR